MEITTSWKEEGKIEGRVEGREAGERSLVVKLLTRKLGSLSPELLAQVNGLNRPLAKVRKICTMDRKSADRK